MVVKYDKLNRFETPKLTLCNPGSVYNSGALTKTVGILTDHEAEEIVFNFNSISELNFRVNKIARENTDENTYANNLYKAIQNRRLVFVDDIGYFMISNVKDGFDGCLHYKDVTAQSIDAEIEQKNIPYIEDGTYRFSTSDTENGLLEKIIEVLPLWTIGEVASSVASKYRTFEDVDTSLNCLGFMMDNMQDAYECIFVFDIINRKVDVYDQADYVRRTNIHITKQDLINSLDVTENADDLYTAISVMGDDNVTIAAINPLGTNVIYNFDYYLSWMTSDAYILTTDSQIVSGKTYYTANGTIISNPVAADIENYYEKTTLGNKVNNWQSLVENSKGTDTTGYYKYSKDYYEALTDKDTLTLDYQKYETQIKMYERCRDNIIAEKDTALVGQYNTVIVENSGTAITIEATIEATVNNINTLIANCENAQISVSAQIETKNSLINTLKSEIDYYNETLSVYNYFSQSEYEELSQYIFEGSYTDDYVTITDSMTYDEKFDQMKILFDRAEARLNRVSQPTQEFDVDVENFIFVKEFAAWSEQLETGCLINVELEQDDIAALFLSSMTINYDDKTLSMTFGNRFNKYDTRSLFDDVLGDISKSSNTLNYIKEILYPIKSGEFNYMKEALSTSRNLTMGAALSSQGEEVIIDGSGYTGRKKNSATGDYEPEQVKITGSNIVFTNDSWESCKTAIGKIILGDNESTYGINAEAIIGDILIGNTIRILDDDGKDLFTVVDGKIETKIEEFADSTVSGGTKTVSQVLQEAQGLSIKITELENKGVNSVETETGYTFNKDGLHISNSSSNIVNVIDNEGMTVQRLNGTTTEDVLIANDDGVNAINLTSRQYLIIGNHSRFGDYNDGTDGNRTACFYLE